MASEPKTLQEAILFFSNPDNCLEYVVARRWPNGVFCPTCGSASVSFLINQRKWQCSSHHKQRQFSAKTGTVMEDSPLGLNKWLPALWLIANCKNGVSSYEIHRALGVTQKTAWFLLHRGRLAMQAGSLEKKFCGEVEADETFIGGKVANMSKARQAKLKADGRSRRGLIGKAIVSGLLDCHTKEARVKVMPNVRAFHLRTNIIENVERGSKIYSDALRSYRNVGADGFFHEFIDHTESYVRGAVHTNGLENFWSLLKRSLKGTYVSVEPFHLQAYCDEQAFRFNNRWSDDAERLDLAVKGITGKRVTYKQLTGKTEEAEQS